MRMDDDTSTPMMNTMPKMMMMFDVHHVNEINVSKDAFRGCAATEHVQGCVSICPSDQAADTGLLSMMMIMMITMMITYQI